MEQMTETATSLLPRGKRIWLNGEKTGELWRSYKYFKDGHEIVETIKNPVCLVVTDNGHRIVDGQGLSHYMPYGWVHLWWRSKAEAGFFCNRSEEEKRKMLETPESVIEGAAPVEARVPNSDKVEQYIRVMDHDRPWQSPTQEELQNWESGADIFWYDPDSPESSCLICVDSVVSSDAGTFRYILTTWDGTKFDVRREDLCLVL